MQVVNHPILIVDDEDENLDLLDRFLRRKYRPILRARDGQEGLEILNHERVDLILTDHRMPRVMGTELLEQAVELQPHAIRVLITGYGDAETLTAAINDGHTFQVLNKPVDLNMLEMVVRRALEAYEANIRERELFESFVLASVSAIEQRDPTTAGHSYRVTAMTTGLALVVDGISEGPLASVHFSRDDIEQIKYASLLHDFGKIGVREAVLVKAHKLPQNRLELLLYRLGVATRYGAIAADDQARYRAVIEHLNHPATLAAEHQEELELLAAAPFVEPEDLDYLRLGRGSLAPHERAQIQSHVDGTIQFLRQLPWPQRLSRVVEIAGAHHERLDGSGYPTGTTTIPIEAQMMAICDIFDALVASDRPYKTAVSHNHALTTLRAMAEHGAIDAALLDCFISRKVHRSTRRM